MSVTASTSITSLGTIPLATSSHLFPDACNPLMDLVAVCSEISSHSDSSTGKTKPAVSLCTLHRLSGGKVWQTEVQGEIKALTWSPDGLHLSVLSLAQSIELSHLSVHDGTIAFSMPLDVVADISGQWSLEWQDDVPQPELRLGSPSAVIDLLPPVTPVEPPKMPLFAPQPSAKTPKRHRYLATFPSLLPIPFRMLVHPPGSAPPLSLLCGTFPSASVDATSLAVAAVAESMSALFETLILGFEAAVLAWKDGARQTVIWREELETCGEQQGASAKAVHADLYKLLLTGRSSPAVSDWLGNRLTGRVISKWELALESSLKTILKLISESIQPAMEKIVLLLEQLGQFDSAFGHDRNQLSTAMALARRLFAVVEEIRGEARHQSQAALEWFRWLKYEISRTATRDSQDNLPFLHDLNLVWVFMKDGFVDSCFRYYFPDQIQSVTSLPKHVLSIPTLDHVLQQTYNKLHQPTRHADISMDSSCSPKRPSRNAFKESPQEPLSLTIGLIASCEALVKSRSEGALPRRLFPGGFAKRAIGEDVWLASTEPSFTRFLLAFLPNGQIDRARTAVFGRPQMVISTVEFFDDVELVVLGEDRGKPCLFTLEYAELGDKLGHRQLGFDIAPVQDFSISRLHPLSGRLSSSVALNGRQGRRVCCVSNEREIQVFDMEGWEEESMSDA